ncbi:MAG: cation diffusion facilitator family transporter [Bacteroidaceae bacterium]|jgi:cobalt-zinc-cadmium efflux system protein
MEHVHEHHHHHVHQPSTINGIFIASIVLNLLFVIVEAGVGLYENSLGLLSDAGHNLSDVFSLLLALFAFRLAKRHSTRNYTYGYKKGTVLISLLNAIILLMAVGAIIIESIYKFRDPVPVNGAAISWTAGIGILVNGLTAWMLMKDAKGDLNIRGAFLHMAADTLVSVGVVIAGLIITFTGYTVVDPIISLLIAIVILVSTWHLLSESLRMSMDGIPESVDLDKVTACLKETPHVSEVHHLHIWSLSTTETALTAHIVLDKLEHIEPVRESIKSQLGKLGISHSTLEFESTATHCHNHECV